MFDGHVIGRNGPRYADLYTSGRRILLGHLKSVTVFPRRRPAAGLAVKNPIGRIEVEMAPLGHANAITAEPVSGGPMVSGIHCFLDGDGLTAGGRIIEGIVGIRAIGDVI